MVNGLSCMVNGVSSVVNFAITARPEHSGTPITPKTTGFITRLRRLHRPGKRVAAPNKARCPYRGLRGAHCGDSGLRPPGSDTLISERPQWVEICRKRTLR